MEMNLLRRAQEEVATADNLRDTHQGIVHHDSQLIGPSPVAAAQDVVATGRREVHLLRAVVPVGESDDLIRDKEANGSRGGTRGTR